MSNHEKINSSNKLIIPEEIERQMPDGIEPGSFLHSIRHPLSHILWLTVEDLGLDNVPKIKNAFSRHINPKHFGNKSK